MNSRKTQNLSAGISDNLATVLEEEIVTLGLAPEARLTEEEIAEKYGVSRSPVRDALRTLEREGAGRTTGAEGYLGSTNVFARL